MEKHKESRTEIVDLLQDLRQQLAETQAAGSSQNRFNRSRLRAFSRLLDASPLGILYIDVTGTIVYENPALRRIIGLPQDQQSPGLGAGIADLPSIQEAGVLPLLNRCQQGETIAGEIVHFRSEAGTEVDVEVHAAPIFDESGDWEGAIAMVQDITSRLMSEQESRQHMAQLTALREVGLELATELNLDNLLHSIASRAVALLGERSGGLFLHKPDRDRLEWAVSVGTNQVPIGSPLERGEGLSGRVWDGGEAVIINDYQDWEGRAPDFRDYAWTASVGAPIRWGDEFLGVLVVQREDPGAFIRDDADLLSLFATQAAIAVKNVRLHTRTELRLQEQIALRQAGTAISSALDLETVLTSIAEQMARIIDATSAVICSFEADSRLTTVMAEHLSPSAGEQERVSDLGETYVEGNLQFIEKMKAGTHDIADLDDPDLIEGERAHMQTYGALTVLFVPLKVADRLLGFAELRESRRSRSFTSDEIALCQALAQQAAIALENARLYQQAQTEIAERGLVEEELRGRNQELSLINRIIAATADQPSAEPVLEVICRELALAFGVPQAAAALLDEEGTAAVVAAEYLAEGRTPSLGSKIPVEGNPSMQFLIEHQAPLAVEDAQEDPRLAAIHPLLKLRGTRSLLLVPLMIDGEVVGSLGMDAIEPHSFSPDQVFLAQRVAEQVSGSLARARLREQQEKLERQLQQAQKMEALGHMAGGVAHDFNNLLTVVRISSQLLERGIRPEDPLREFLDNIQDAGERATDLTGRLLAFSRREVIKPRRLNLNQLVTNLTPMLRRIVGESIEVESSLSDDLWSIRADPSQLDQVVVNLVVNARAAMPMGGQLTIETANASLDEAYVSSHVEARTGDHVELVISDTGSGMDEETMAHLFEPFFTTKERGRGTGMGLATVYGIVKQNGGHIRVYSEKGIGTTFRILVPRAQTADEVIAPEQPVMERPSQGTETILLTEDDPAVRRLASYILSDNGYQVLLASDGQEALKVSQDYEGPIHLLITDVVMPNMNGRDLADTLSNLRSELTVLYMSGYTDNVIMRHGVLEPGTAFVSKPLTMDALTRKVRDVLDQGA